MSNFPNEDPNAPQARRLQEWWLQLPLPYRVNALLYGLGGVALAFLLITLLSSDGRDPQVQVGAGQPVTTTPSTRASLPVTTRPPASSSSSAAPSSSSSSTTAAGGGTTSTTRAVTATTAGTTSTTATTAPPSTTTTAPATCRNSTHPACGAFVWDPPPAADQPLVVAVVARKATAKVGEEVFFDVVVDDPDHLVSANCSEVRFDNGAGADGPCSPPPACPDRHGPWTPPAAKAGRHTGTYINTWDTQGQHTATFKFRSWSPDTCLALDPYASEGTRSVTVTITILGT